MDDDWDLHAVVRGCCSAATPSAVTTSTPVVPQPYVVSFSSKQSCSLSVTDQFQSRNFIGDLDDLYKPFFPKSSSLYSTVCAPVSSSPASFSVAKEHRPKQQKQSICSRSKRRKNQLKKVCQVPAEAIASDVWAWRKYGQKPIKGSPYPRGYYRCSSSKGCLARKQVERNRSDPGIFIVTYTGEHNHSAPTHRNSLAGSTRQKSTTPGEATQPSPTKPSCSSPTTSEGEAKAQSTNTESRDDEEEEEFGEFSDVGLSDDFFAGLEELTAPAAVDCFSDHFPASFGLPSLANSAATAAGGI